MTATARRSVPRSPDRPAPARSRRSSCDYWAKHGMVSEPIPFDGRSDYVGFVNRGIPAGGVFAGAEAPKTAEQVAKYGGVQGEQLDPCYHEACDTYATVTGQPPASTMNTFAHEPGARSAAGGQPQRQRAALAGAVQGHARARRLVLRAASRTPSRRRRPPRRPRRPSAPTGSSTAATGALAALTSLRDSPPRPMPAGAAIRPECGGPIRGFWRPGCAEDDLVVRFAALDEFDRGG